MTNRCVLDASALLALVLAEPGESVVRARGENGLISAVNYSETLAKLAERGFDEGSGQRMLDMLDLEIVPFDREQAVAAAGLREDTRSLGLSFADRACLALASTRQLSVLTSDRQWRALRQNIEIVLIRD
jgi:ribonuclease VapC